MQSPILLAPHLLVVMWSYRLFVMDTSFGYGVSAPSTMGYSSAGKRYPYPVRHLSLSC